MMARPGLPRPRSVSRPGSYPAPVPIPATVPTRSEPVPRCSCRCDPGARRIKGKIEPRNTRKVTEEHK